MLRMALYHAAMNVMNTAEAAIMSVATLSGLVMNAAVGVRMPAAVTMASAVAAGRAAELAT